VAAWVPGKKKKRWLEGFGCVVEMCGLCVDVLSRDEGRGRVVALLILGVMA